MSYDTAATGHRILFVHAHPDDETLATGLAMANAALAGHEVHLLTCTLGDEGEIIPPELAHLGPDADDTLGAYRRGELRAAMACLGVDEVVLGEAGTGDDADAEGAGHVLYRDSGMAGTDSNADPRSFVAGDEDRQVRLVAEHVRRIAPDVVVTYDEHGGYGHPDHVHTHDVTCAAVASLPEQERPVLLAAVTPASWAREDRAWVASHLDAHPVPGIVVPAPDEEYAPSVVDDAVPTHEVLPSDEAIARRDAAMGRHRTQITVHDGVYTLSNDIAARLTRREAYVVLDPATGRPAQGEACAQVGDLPGFRRRAESDR